MHVHVYVRVDVHANLSSRFDFVHVTHIEEPCHTHESVIPGSCWGTQNEPNMAECLPKHMGQRICVNVDDTLGFVTEYVGICPRGPSIKSENSGDRSLLPLLTHHLSPWFAMSTSSDTTSGTHAHSESAIMIRDGIATKCWLDLARGPPNCMFRKMFSF